MKKTSCYVSDLKMVPPLEYQAVRTIISSEYLNEHGVLRKCVDENGDSWASATPIKQKKKKDTKKHSSGKIPTQVIVFDKDGNMSGVVHRTGVQLDLSKVACERRTEQRATEIPFCPDHNMYYVIIMVGPEKGDTLSHEDGSIMYFEDRSAAIEAEVIYLNKLAIEKPAAIIQT